MRTDTLKELSLDPTGSRYAIKCSNIDGYDLDDFVKKTIKSNEYDYLNDKKSTADALIDCNINTHCDFLNFIEFKVGGMQFRQIRHKAVESLSVYAEWKNITEYRFLPPRRQFLLVYSTYYGQDLKVRARRIINRLKNDPITNELYKGEIAYCSSQDFDANPLRYLK